MALVRVFGNLFVNPALVGAAVREVVFDEAAQNRRTRTRVLDASGCYTLAYCETVVSTDRTNPRTDLAVQIDNAIHDEIISSINTVRDARSYAAIEASISAPGTK